MKKLFLLLLVMVFPAVGRAQLLVDCTGATSGTFTSINAALATASPGTNIFVVAGPCNENLRLSGWTNLFIGTYYGSPNVAINGGVNVVQSHGVYLHGLNITSATGDGINVSQSQALVLDNCASSGNAGNGLSLGSESEVSVIAPASFDGNTFRGINVDGNSYVELSTWNGQSIDISNNHDAGVWASQASFTTSGRTTIANNLGVGMQLFGGARFQVGAFSGTGPNFLTGNQQGGASIQENSEISFFNFGSQTFIQNNGPVGVSAGFGSQVTLYDQVEISGHSGPAVDLFASSQARLFGANSIHNNGASGDPRSAAIRLDGNSEVFLRGGSVTQNVGPAVLVLVNSSADLTGVSFSSNTGGIILCDSSAYMVSDLGPTTGIAPGVSCRTPHSLGNRSVPKPPFSAPDWSALKALQAKYMAIATKK